MKLISNQINPHFTLPDALQALSCVLIGGKPDFTQNFGTQNFCLTNTARSALGLIIDIVKPDENKKIALPAFICAVVATPFLERGYQIEWIDTDENGVIDVTDFEKKASNVSLVVVPHIFGQSAPLKAISEIAKKQNIFVVEDGAHLLNKKFDHCHAKIWSFGREKVISCVSGGALLWPHDSKYHQAFSLLELPAPSLWWQVQHALQPLVFALGQSWWHRGGKLIPMIFRRLNLLPLAVTKSERQGTEDVPVCALGFIQQRVLAQQWKKHSPRLKHAQAISQIWKNLAPKNVSCTIPESALRVILKFDAPTERNTFMQAIESTKAFHLRDWDGVPISPYGINLAAFGYTLGQCPRAELFARTYLTLPTNIRVGKNDLKRLEKQMLPPKIDPTRDNA